MKFQIATNWEELNNWQLQKIAKVLYTEAPSKIMHLKIAYYLFIGKPGVTRFLKVLVLLLSVPVSDLQQHFSFVLDGADRYTFPKLKLKKVSLTPPKKALENFTIDQFSFADNLYYYWCKTRKKSFLNGLLTVLYLPKNTLFKKETQALSHSKYIEKLPVAKKYAVVLAYIGNRELLIKRYPGIFKNSGKTPKNTPYTGYDPVMYDMAMQAPQPLGALHQVKTTLAHDFLTVLQKQIKQQQEQLKQQQA